jgi:Flp pilus assembly pilin Flp
MKLLNIFKSFKNDESGAVTVDWVVLTAATVGLGLLVIGVLDNAISSAGTAIQNDVNTAAARP